MRNIPTVSHFLLRQVGNKSVLLQNQIQIPMTQRKKICIYCASSRDIDRAYFDAAERLGTLLAEKGIACICGAGSEGLLDK